MNNKLEEMYKTGKTKPELVDELYLIKWTLSMKQDQYLQQKAENEKLKLENEQLKLKIQELERANKGELAFPDILDSNHSFNDEVVRKKNSIYDLNYFNDIPVNNG